MKPKSTLRHILSLCGISVLAISFASAQDNGTWTQSESGTYDWFDTGNWLDSTIASGQDATASFTESATGVQTANLTSALTLGNITLDRDQNLTIAGSETETLTLDVTSGTPTSNVNSGRTLNMNAELAGSDGLQLQGGGTLNIFSPVTLTGGVTINGSTLAVLPTGSFIAAANTIGNGPITISEGGSLLLRGGNTSSSQVFIGTGGGTMQNRGNNVYQTTGILTGSGTLTYSNAGGNGGRRLEFNSTDNDFTGGFVLTRGDAVIQVNSLVDSTNNIAFNAGGIFRYGSGAEAALTLNERAFELNAGTGIIENANTTHAITINTDLLATGGGAKTLTLSAAAGPANVFAGIIANETDEGEGTVALSKMGGGTWTLTGANTYTGNTTVSGGTLTLADTSESRFLIGDIGVNNAILGSGTANLNGLFVFDLTGASTTVGDFWTIVNVGSLNESYGITFSVSSTQGAFSETSPGIWTISENGQEYEFSQDTGVLTVIGEPSGTPYELWAGDGVLFDGDESGDGVSNGLAFLLGAASPNDSALDLLPEASEDAGALILTFDMLDTAARGTASLAIEYSTTLAAGSWETVTVPDTSSTVDDVVFTITGTSPLEVTATIPASKAADGKLFARLNGVSGQ